MSGDVRPDRHALLELDTLPAQIKLVVLRSVHQAVDYLAGCTHTVRPPGHDFAVSTHAFVDESVRGQRYLVSAALVDPSDLVRLRKVLRTLLLPGQRELHFQKEKPQRRRQLADRIVAAGATIAVYTACCHNNDEAARRRCLQQLAQDLTAAGAHRLVLDGRAGRDVLDARTLRAALGRQPSRGGLTYEHLESTQEPLLWIPDALGWCYGAQGDWRRRVASAINAVIDCDQL